MSENKKKSQLIGKIFYCGSLNSNPGGKYFLQTMEAGLFLMTDLWSGRMWTFTARDLTNFQVIPIDEFLPQLKTYPRQYEVACEILRRLGVAVESSNGDSHVS